MSSTLSTLLKVEENLDQNVHIKVTKFITLDICKVFYVCFLFIFLCKVLLSVCHIKELNNLSGITNVVFNRIRTLLFEWLNSRDS